MILAGDIGGTKTLLALFRPQSFAIACEERYSSATGGDFDSMLDAFLRAAQARLGAVPHIEAACFGVAGPIEGEHVQVTNLPLALDAAAIAQRFAIGRVRLLNDFVAAAHGIPRLSAEQVVTLQAGEPQAQAPRVLLGAGTGLGIAYLVPDGRGSHQVVASEGGHAGFAPADARQAGLWRALYEHTGRVELEHVLSGPGLLRAYEFLTGQAEGRIPDTPEQVAQRALAGTDATAVAALDLFIACFGAAAGDHALNVLARGGVYVAGGIAPKILPRLRAGGFLASFNDKGSFAAQTRRVPVHVVIEERLALLGAANAAFELRQLKQ